MALKRQLLSLLCVASLLGLSVADQPVHCKFRPRLTPLGVKSGIVGSWVFRVHNEHFNVDLFKMNEICSHRLPNKYVVLFADFCRLQLLTEGEEFNFDKYTDYYVELEEPNLARLYKHPKTSSSEDALELG